jgi:WD40 repeat protein/mono/diheme cytochrome c family protein
MRSVVSSLAVALLAAAPARAQDKTELARKAREVLKANCQRCHHREAAEGGFGYVTDLAALVERRKVVPGDAAKSKLLRRIADKDDPMPPAGEKQRPSAEDVALLRRWVEAGAPDDAVAARRDFLSDADVIKLIGADLERVERRDRPFTRYFTLTHLYNAGRSEDELQTYRAGLSKLVNSLSWGRRIVVPRPIDPPKTIFRIDLRDYRWDEKVWEAILYEYPYGGLIDVDATKGLREATDCPLPFVRADWFVFAASRPPLYHDVLQLPKTDRELEEKELKVDVAKDVRQERAARAGFNESGVSRNNRLIERHESAYGAYWKSYDFAGNAGPENLFQHPLDFRHAGGEIIFNLPNGLQAYLLVDGKGNRIDRGPVAIVSDPKQPDRNVVNGVSCMSCHSKGMIDKADQVRAVVEKNKAAFGDEADTILALYQPREKFAALLREDAERFAEAVKKSGAHLSQTEPVAALALLFERELDLPLAAAEAGLKTEAFREKLAKSPKLGRTLGPLAVEGGTVQRQAFVEAFGDVVREMRTDVKSPLPLWRGPFRVQGILLSVAYSPDGKALASGGGDKIIRLWDVATGKQVATLDGHGSEVGSLAYSPDGKALAAGSGDGTIKLWDTGTTKETATLKGHTGRVCSVAFSPDGKTLASASVDEAVIKLWDVAAGKGKFSLKGHTGDVIVVTFSPDGKTLASGSVDKMIKLWDVATGQERATLIGHTGMVHDVAFSPDGKTLASCGGGGLDKPGEVKLWDVATGRERATLKGHTGGVVSVAFSPDGKTLASGGKGGGFGTPGEVKLWNTATGRELATLRGHTELVSCGAFSVDGKMFASGGLDNTIRLWDVATGKERTAP